MGYFVFSSYHTFLFQTLQTERLSPSPDHLLHFLEMIRFSLRFEIVQSLQPTSWTEIGNLVSCEADHKLCFQNFKVANHKHCWISTGTCKQSVKSINIFTILDPQGDNRNFSEIPHRFACVNISCYVHNNRSNVYGGSSSLKVMRTEKCVCLSGTQLKAITVIITVKSTV